MTLGLYWPTPGEVASGVLADPAAYECAVRHGWMLGATGHSAPRQSVRMCIEGGVFPSVAQHHGAVADLRPAGYEGHPVWRSGLALPIPFHAPKTMEAIQ